MKLLASLLLLILHARSVLMMCHFCLLSGPYLPSCRATSSLATPSPLSNGNLQTKFPGICSDSPPHSFPTPMARVSFRAFVDVIPRVLVLPMHQTQPENPFPWCLLRVSLRPRGHHLAPQPPSASSSPLQLHSSLRPGSYRTFSYHWASTHTRPPP